MDELVIGEKKYVSSKQAAKITGYAKDYVGQLCREGRVPARLVGRTWYVLQSAIQDHRFGIHEASQEIEIPHSEEHAKNLLQLPETWEAPRYEQTEVEVLPPINRLSQKDSSPIDTAEFTQPNDQWKSWFDHFTEEESSQTNTSGMSGMHTVQTTEALPGEELAPKAENVPIHIIERRYPPRELLPTRIPDTNILSVAKGIIPNTVQNQSITKRKNLFTTLFAALSVVVSIISITVAFVNSGYVDNQLTVLGNRASLITGFSIYSKTIK